MTRGYERYLGKFEEEPVGIEEFIIKDMRQRFSYPLHIVVAVEKNISKGYEVFAECITKVDRSTAEEIRVNFNKSINNYRNTRYFPKYRKFE